MFSSFFLIFSDNWESEFCSPIPGAPIMFSLLLLRSFASLLLASLVIPSFPLLIVTDVLFILRWLVGAFCAVLHYSVRTKNLRFKLNNEYRVGIVRL